MMSSLAIANNHFRALFLKFANSLMFLNIQIDLLILKTYYGQFTLTTKKSLHIIFKAKFLGLGLGLGLGLQLLALALALNALALE